MRLLKRIAQCLITDLSAHPVVFRCLTFWVFRYACLHDVQSVNKLVQTEDGATLRTEVPESYQRRITPMQARLIDAQIDQIDADSNQRIARARRYREGLAGLQQVMLPPDREDRSHTYLCFPVQVRNRWDVVKFMMRNGRDLSVQHITNTADLPCFAEFHRDCPNARATSEQVVLLPTYPSYAMREVDKTVSVHCAAISAWTRRSRRLRRPRLRWSADRGDGRPSDRPAVSATAAVAVGRSAPLHPNRPDS